MQSIPTIHRPSCTPLPPCRLASPEHTSATDSAEALGTALPVLITKGLASRLPFVKANSIETLSSIIDVVKPAQVGPHLPTLIQALLESLSNLESASFNRVAMHADSLGVDKSKLEERRVALSNQTPMHSSLDRCVRLVDESTIDAVVPVLTSLIHRGVFLRAHTLGSQCRPQCRRTCMPSITIMLSSVSPSCQPAVSVQSPSAQATRMRSSLLAMSPVHAGVGVNTRTGTARFIVSLQSRLPSATLQKPAGDLLKALLGALRTEPAGATRKAFAAAVGALAKAASAKRVNWTAAQALEIFATGTRLPNSLYCSVHFDAAQPCSRLSLHPHATAHSRTCRHVACLHTNMFAAIVL